MTPKTLQAPKGIVRARVTMQHTKAKVKTMPFLVFMQVGAIYVSPPDGDDEANTRENNRRHVMNEGGEGSVDRKGVENKVQDDDRMSVCVCSSAGGAPELQLFDGDAGNGPCTKILNQRYLRRNAGDGLGDRRHINSYPNFIRIIYQMTI